MTGGPRFVEATVILVISLSMVPFLGLSYASEVLLSPPPTPPFTLTAARINEITYVIRVKNVNASWVTVDFALPATKVPDTFVKIKEVRVDGPAHTDLTYSDRGNPRMRVYTPELKPSEDTTVTVTFYSLKYRLDYPTHQPIIALAYPNEYTVFTQPENYIESDSPLIISKAQTLVGNRTNTFRIAERMYDFARSYITWTSQSDIRGALYALQNGRGDCTEFGTLFVSLMRAVGIPARVVVGHVGTELAQGGIANATSLWVDSPHLWAEFHVEGYGWVPVDPTFGRNDPQSHFGTSWAYYFPLIRGPTMDGPNHSLVSIRHAASTRIEFTSELVVTPLASAPFDTAIHDFIAANDRTNLARRVASRAYDFSFDVTETYPLLETGFTSLINATKALDQGDLSLTSQYSSITQSSAHRVLETISNAVMNQAEIAIDRAWNEFRILGALGGQYYLRIAKDGQNSGDYLSVVQTAYFAKTTADQAPNIFIFLGPVAFSVFVVGLTRRNGRRRVTPIASILQKRESSKSSSEQQPTPTHPT